MTLLITLSILLGILLAAFVVLSTCLAIKRHMDNPPKIQRPEGAVKVQFIPHDGIPRKVDTVACPICKNYFWVESSEIEVPSYCPYCGTRYHGAVLIESDELKTYMPDPEL